MNSINAAAAEAYPTVVSTPSYSYQAFQALRAGFTIAPIVAGADKFVGLLTNWDKYLAPAATNAIAAVMPAHTFMLVVGVIEILAGLIVAVKPRIGAYIVCAWLLGIIVNLIMLGSYYDVALRDLGLAIGAFALGRLAQEYST
jgi:hypothetical protein